MSSEILENISLYCLISLVNFRLLLIFNDFLMMMMMMMMTIIVVVFGVFMWFRVYVTFIVVVIVIIVTLAYFLIRIIDHFTVDCLVTWPLNGSKAGGVLVLIQTSHFLSYKSSFSYAKYLAFKWEKQRGLYPSKVTSSLTCIHGQVTKHTTVKWPVMNVCFYRIFNFLKDWQKMRINNFRQA